MQSNGWFRLSRNPLAARFVCVELLFMPSVYAPCATCYGARYNAKTLEIQYRGKNIAEVLAMTVDGASPLFAEQPQVSHALPVLQDVGLGILAAGAARD